MAVTVPAPADGRSAPLLLVDRALGLGDLCTAVPAIRALAAGFPDHRVVLAAPAWLEPLARAAGAHALVPVDGLTASMPDAVRQPAIAVNMHGRGPESIERLLALDPDHLITFRHDDVAASSSGPTWREDEHEVDRWCRLVAAFGLDPDPTDLTIDLSTGANPWDGVVIIHPGAASAGRRWPVDRFAEVVRHVHRRGRRVVLTGSAGERSLADEIVRRAGPTAGHVEPPCALAGTTDIRQLVRIIAGADLLVSNDTGVAHVATATATPSVVLFGPTAPSRWGPPCVDRHCVIWHGIESNPHAEQLDPGLAAITVDEVVAAVDRQLAAVEAG